MTEGTGLHAVAVDLARRTGERALDETRDHHPVLAGLLRPDGVEQSDDHAVKPPLLVEAEREELVDRLRVRVQPAALAHRAVDATIVLRQRAFLAVIAVHLGARRDEHALVELVAVLEDRLGAADVRDHRVHRLLDDQPHADRGSEVVHDVALVDELADDRGRQHRVNDEVEPRPVAQLLDVAMSPGREIVEDVDLLTLLEQLLGEVGADEAGTACDQRLLGHRASLTRATAALSQPFHTGRPGLPRVPATSPSSGFARYGCVEPLGYT